jgi:hypothetical protein
MIYANKDGTTSRFDDEVLDQVTSICSFILSGNLGLRPPPHPAHQSPHLSSVVAPLAVASRHSTGAVAVLIAGRGGVLQPHVVAQLMEHSVGLHRVGANQPRVAQAPTPH